MKNTTPRLTAILAMLQRTVQGLPVLGVPASPIATIDLIALLDVAQPSATINPVLI
jgi:hypothetical protein